MGEAPKTIRIDGVVAKRDFGAEQIGVPSKTGWPITCVDSGVNAADAQKLRDHFKAGGLSVDVSEGGDPIYTSAVHRKKALKFRGFVDKSGFE